MNTQSQTKPKAILLFGPTAVGKTALTENLFSKGFEIINADSVQVYRGLDIGSAKPSEALMAQIPHHLVNIRDPWEDYSVGEFVHDADDAIKDISSRGLIPLITGGTAYYFRHLLYGAPKTPPSDAETRKSVEKEIEEKGKDWAYEYLEDIDPVAAEKINKNDIYRVSRAIEVYRASGKPLSSFTLSKEVRKDIDFIVIGLERDREELKKRIRLRVDEMFETGLYDEIKRLMKEGAEATWPSMEAIGYREFFTAAFEGECSISTIKEEIVKASEQYARRQITFFSSFSTARFFHPDDQKGIADYLHEKGIATD